MSGPAGLLRNIEYIPAPGGDDRLALSGGGGRSSGAGQESARSRLAIYGCGYNSCGCNLRLSEVRSGSILGPVWGPKGPKPTPNDPDRTSDNLK